MGKRISQLDLAGPLSQSDTFPVVQGNRTKRATLSQVTALADDACQCTLFPRFTQVGNAANTLQQYLHTYQMPNDTLPTDGSWLELYSSGQFAANNDVKIVNFHFGSSTNGISVSGADANSKFWFMSIFVGRTSETTQTITGYIAVMPRAGSPDAVKGLGFKLSGSENLSLSVPISLSVQTDTSTANNILVDDYIGRVNYVDPNS